MLNKIYQLENSVDVYVSTDENSDKHIVTFHKITTRDRIQIHTSQDVVRLLSLFDGNKTLQQLLQELGGVHQIEPKPLIEFLLRQHIILEVCQNQKNNSRYQRQIAYFHDFILNRTGQESQDLLAQKQVVLLGCGAVNAIIAEILVRMGVGHFVLIDYKNVTASMLDRHLFLRPNDIGTAKAVALAAYLKRIDANTKITVIQEKLYPETELSKWIPNTSDLVINQCDEPYIGHTALKIGRYLHGKKIAMYVTGGFDAHLMSSGELVFPPLTPCIDCVQQTFNIALADWKPTYTNTYVSDEPLSETISTEQQLEFFVGGAGGIVEQSYFSANIACVRIIHFLLEDSAMDWQITRYEYLINRGELTEFTLNKQLECPVCG